MDTNHLVCAQSRGRVEVTRHAFETGDMVDVLDPNKTIRRGRLKGTLGCLVAAMIFKTGICRCQTPS